jgi:rRNA-processing protein FCF1
MKVILDTNFLIDCIRFRIDVKDELSGNEIYVLDSVMFEIDKIAQKETQEASLARMASEFIEKNEIMVLESKTKNADKALVAYAREGYAIATQDKGLKDKVKRGGGRVFYIRQQSYVVFE